MSYDSTLYPQVVWRLWHNKWLYKKISHHVHPNGCEIAYPLYTEAHSKLFVEFELGGKYIYFSDKLIGNVYKFNAIQTICISSYGGVAGFKR